MTGSKPGRFQVPKQNQMLAAFKLCKMPKLFAAAEIKMQGKGTTPDCEGAGPNTTTAPKADRWEHSTC